MNKTYLEMKTSVGSDVRDTSSAMLSKVGEYINNRYREVKRRFNFLNNATYDYSITTTAGTEDYVLPEDFKKEITVVDKTNKRELKPLSLQQWSEAYVSNLDSQGSLTNYIILESPVKKQPSSAGVVSITSSSTDDTTQSVYVRGIDASGNEDYESISVNGTAVIAGTKSFSRIIGVSKSAVSAGYITVTRGADTLSVLGREDRVSYYKIIRFIMTPNATITVEIAYIQEQLPLRNDYDYPLIDCSEVVEAGALADAWRYKRQFSKAQELERIFEKRLANLVWDKENSPNQVHLFNPKPYSRETV